MTHSFIILKNFIMKMIESISIFLITNFKNFGVVEGRENECNRIILLEISVLQLVHVQIFLQPPFS